MERQEDIIRLIVRYRNRKATPGEVERLLRYIHEEGKEELIKNALSDGLLDNVPEASGPSAEVQQRLDRVLSHLEQQIMPPAKPKRRTVYAYISVAATILAVLVTGWYFYREEPVVVQGQDLNPGGNRAILTLADGTSIDLDSVPSGQLAEQSNAVITKTDDGRIIYKSLGKETTTDIKYNTITVPKGGQYQLILPDGSRVWLNAQSVLRYPVTFSTRERSVTFRGEAYFDIVSAARAPFHIETDGQRIEVLGTTVNLTAYDTGPTATTLVSGSVRVTNTISGKSTVLQPGQQARLSGSDMRILPADIDAVSGWKDGTFIFHDEDLGTLMLQLSRWYDFEVDPEALPKKRFAGILPRNTQLSKILQVIEAETGLKFTITERRLHIEK